MESVMAIRPARMRTERDGGRGMFSIFVVASMWLVAGVGIFAAPLRNQTTLFRRSPEPTEYAAVVAGETSSCSVPGICW